MQLTSIPTNRVHQQSTCAYLLLHRGCGLRKSVRGKFGPGAQQLAIQGMVRHWNRHITTNDSFAQVTDAVQS